LIIFSRLEQRTRLPSGLSAALERPRLAVRARPDDLDEPGRLVGPAELLRSTETSLHLHLGPLHLHSHRQGRGEAGHVESEIKV
jgi:hypothetical protein